ncbi:hypothetical protein LCGC14_1324270 [marine sediment metagenome]|uniref:Uncharacterized protein n=1 Tax=marine sediment metagenome TaxID=412755 RepID=A0A0F9KIL8_9ZZZZ
MSINPVFTVLWGTIFGVGLIVEIVALRRDGKGDTLSEHVWKLLRINVVVWFVALGFFAWLIIHFFGFGLVDAWLRGL